MATVPTAPRDMATDDSDPHRGALPTSGAQLEPIDPPLSQDQESFVRARLDASSVRPMNAVPQEVQRATGALIILSRDHRRSPHRPPGLTLTAP